MIKLTKAINMFKSKIKRLLPYFLLAVAVIIAYTAIGEIRSIINFIGGIFARIWDIITPFFYGFMLAYIMHMPFDAMQRLLGKFEIKPGPEPATKRKKAARRIIKFITKRKKAISLVIILILIALIIFTVSYLVIPAIHDSINYFITSLPDYYESARGWLDNLNNWEIFRALNINVSIDGIIEMLEEWMHDFSLDYLASGGVDALVGISTAIFGVGTAIFTGFLAFISSLYFLLEKDKIKYFLCRLLVIFTPVKVHDGIIKYGGKLDENFKQYIKTQTIDGCILGTIVTIELLIMRSPFALVLGIMLGIVNYIPYFGSIFGTLVVIVIVAFTQGIQMALIATVVLLITQQIDANIIQPRLMGGSFKLSPLLIIISITIGGAIAGVFGMIIAIPIIAVLKDVLEDIIKYHEHHKLEKANETDKADEAD